MCYEQPALTIQPADGQRTSPTASSHSILVAVPSRDDKKIEVYQFPDEKLVSFVPRVQTTDTGMVMAVKLAHHQSSKSVLVIAGYEGGFTAVHLLNLHPKGPGKSLPEFARLIYLSQPHTQPVLSLDATPDANVYFTSSADAVIAAHQIPDIPTHVDHGDEPESIWTRKKDAQTKPATEASTQTAEDLTAEEEAEFLRLLSTEDATSYLPSASPPLSSLPSPTHPPPSTSPPLSFIKQPLHQPSSSTAPKAGLSSLLSNTAPSNLPSKLNPPPSSFNTAIQSPYKIIQTKHAGQQSLSVRSDGRLFVTGGWDSRIRVYSAKTLKEVACLKWHKEGVYAVGFGAVLDEEEDGKYGYRGSDDGVELVKHGVGSKLSKLQRQREEHVRKKHWVVAGSKDGKISLWEVF